MAPLYSKPDFVLMLIKGTLLPIVSVCFFSWIGLLYLQAFWFVYYRFLKHAFLMEPLAALDEFFLLDNDKNRANIVTVIKSSKENDYAKLR